MTKKLIIALGMGMLSTSFGSILEESTYTYNNLSQLSNLSNSSAKGLTNSFSYSYNQNNEITSSNGINYVYDADDRLTSDGTQYDFDLSNNLRQIGNNTRAYNARNELTEYQGITYQYDAAGNLLNNYSYNALNEMTSIDQTNYYYDGLGNQLYSTGDWARKFYYINATLMNIGQESYLFGSQREVHFAQEYNEIYQYDAHGSVVSSISPSGDTLFSYHYDSYGNSGIKGISFGYNGQLYEDGTYVDGIRNYAANLGIFSQEDPTEFDGQNILNLNGRLFSNGDPINQNDPSGRFAAWIGVSMAGALTISGMVFVYNRINNMMNRCYSDVSDQYLKSFAKLSILRSFQKDEKVKKSAQTQKDWADYWKAIEDNAPLEKVSGLRANNESKPNPLSRKDTIGDFPKNVSFNETVSVGITWPKQKGLIKMEQGQSILYDNEGNAFLFSQNGDPFTEENKIATKDFDPFFRNYNGNLNSGWRDRSVPKGSWYTPPKDENDLLAD